MRYFLALVCMALSLNAFGQHLSQEVISGAGTSAKNGKTTLSWTVGEPVISSSNPRLSQGFHQGDLRINKSHPARFVDPEVLAAAEKVGLSFIVYPNPTSNSVTLSSQQDIQPGTAYRIYNVSGSLLSSGDLIDRQTQIDLSHFSGGTYFLVITDNDIPVGEFRIIKQ